MATRTSAGVGKNSSRFTSVLASAVLEWCLIFMLLLDAFFSYLVTKFAHVCELQTPCLLCSRLDHVLGSEKPGFYSDLICHAHKLEISKLVYDYNHEKPTDGHGMCKDCISSITTDKKSDGGTNKSSASKSERYIEYCVEDDHSICLKSTAVIDGYSAQIRLHQKKILKDPLLKVPTLGASSAGLCSCSTEPWSKTQRLLRTKSIGDGDIELDCPTSGIMVHDNLHCKDGFKKRREKLSGSTLGSYLGNQGFDRLPYIGYTELKISSDSESEVLISDDDDDDDDDKSNLVCTSNYLMEESVAQCLQPDIDCMGADILPKTLFSDSILDKVNYQTFMPQHSLSVPLEKSHTSDSSDSTLIASAAAIGNKLNENCNQDESWGNSPAVSLPISLDKSSSSNNVIESPAEGNKEKHVVAIGDTVCLCHTENMEVSKQGSGSISTNSSVQINHTVIDPGSSMPSCISMDINNAHKVALGIKGSQPSATLTELQSTKDSAAIYGDDLKLLLSQAVAIQGLELSCGDKSPRVNKHSDDSKMTDTFTVTGLQMLPKRCSIERNESGLEPLDGSLVCKIEGDSAVDMLKQQIEMDHKSMNNLYKELEEERNASAIAVNQAMAMISRLQEERAAVQMEAFQYQRMMEEQTDYDQRALQEANDLLTDREKEIQDLKEELETYRKRYPSDLWGEKTSALINDSKGTETRAVLHENNTDYKAYKMGTQKDTLLDFEGEKFYISKCLKSLENKLRFSDNGVHVDSFELDSERAGSPDDKCVDLTLHVFSEDQDQPLSADNLAGNCGYPQMESHVGSDMKDVYSTAFAENNVVSIWKQISHVNERLETLEED